VIKITDGCEVESRGPGGLKGEDCFSSWL